ncbi:MAG: hypothetical protein V7761_12020 [Amylibacter sp.]
MAAPDEAKPYAECQRLLGIAPLNELHRHVDEGRGAEISSNRFGKTLIGIECTEIQITRYMEKHGFIHTYMRSWPEIERSHVFGDCNKQLNFCASHNNWIDRLLMGKCAVGASIYLLNDTIKQVSAAGTK